MERLSGLTSLAFFTLTVPSCCGYEFTFHEANIARENYKLTHGLQTSDTTKPGLI